MKNFSYLTNSHPSFIESLYEQYLENRSSIDQEFCKFFDGFDYALSQISESEERAVPSSQLHKEFQVYQLIQAYKKKGHLISTTNPIRPREDRSPELDIKNYQLEEEDLTRRFQATKYAGIEPHETLQKAIDELKSTYCGNFGVEYTYIRHQEKIEWLEQMLTAEMKRPIPLPVKRRILEKLTEADVFETFLHKKYIGQKRFSLEGGENTITLIDQLIETVAENDASEVVIGMTHRGRLNILANVLGKTYEQIFSEFEGTTPTESTMGTGDVKYHMGFSSYVKTQAGKSIYLKLAPNPSHLETVGSIVMGYTRNKINTLYNKNRQKVVPLMLHGDASIAGQGIVYELLQMSKLAGYGIGGTIHIVINNQIGFTTNFDDARSSDYCTSIAATMQCPVFHVNGDDPETIARIARIAALYRQKFSEDVFIDILCYRKHGHNEGDDPKYTQPKLYKLIANHPSPREIYMKSLESSESSDETVLAKEMETSFWDMLQQRLDGSKQHPLPYTLQRYEKRWSGFRTATAKDFEQSPKTSITKKTLQTLITQLLTIPSSFNASKKISKQFNEKYEQYKKEGKIDWATAELLAFASLIKEDKRVRISGQDVCRGTFSHRHAVLTDDEGNSYDRFTDIQKGKQKIRFVNSLLSEYAVLGFEYGYAMSSPNTLVVWEAQFGDFVNGAQIIIDQYLASAEQKWGISSGLTLLLPHGFEGQGPEHSSARMERLLQLCSSLNMVITNITTAANLFHALRRQQTWSFRKPLINFAPKANLRAIESYSEAEKFISGSFEEIIDDVSKTTEASIKKVVLCTGKIYFEINAYREKNNIKNVAIMRLEQLFPFPEKQWATLKKKYAKATQWIWAQEEPKNMGAYSYIFQQFSNDFTYISRPDSASPATGFYKKHIEEQSSIIQKIFNQ